MKNGYLKMNNTMNNTILWNRYVKNNYNNYIILYILCIFCDHLSLLNLDNIFLCLSPRFGVVKVL